MTEQEILHTLLPHSTPMPSALDIRGKSLLRYCATRMSGLVLVDIMSVGECAPSLPEDTVHHLQGRMFRFTKD